MGDRLMWCAPEWRVRRGWYYWLVFFNIYGGRVGGKRQWDVCIGFIWTGYVVVTIGGVREL